MAYKSVGNVITVAAGAASTASSAFNQQTEYLRVVAIGTAAIATAFSATLGSSPRAAELRSSQKIAAINSQFTAGKNSTVTAQQVQIVGG